MRKLDTVKPLGGKKISLRSSLVIILLIITISYAFGDVSESSLSTGQRLFLENKPEEAITWLEVALKEELGNRKIYSYLAIAYEQIGEYPKAVDIYNRGLIYAGDLKSVFLTNIANNMVLQGEYDSAINYYTRAIESEYNGDALRNRAGEYLRQELYDKALEDYKLYLTMETSPYQENEIRRVIGLLEQKLDEAVRQKIEEERKRLEEEARQKELLRQVLNSLSSAGDETTNLSAGAEEVEDYNDDFDIVD